MHVPQHQEAVDALITSLDSLVGILYTVATDGTIVPDGVQRIAANSLADRASDDAVALAAWQGTPADVRRSARAVRDGLGLVASAARDLADGNIGSTGAAPTMFEVMEDLALLVDLRWLAGQASPGTRGLLHATVEIIGRLCTRAIGETNDAMAMDSVDESRFPQPDRPTLTLLLRSDVTNEADDALQDLHAAGVPYSVLAREGSGVVERLWFPGMRLPLRRRVLATTVGRPRPVLTWNDHLALVTLSEQGIPYSELVLAFLNSGLHEPPGGLDVEVLSRAAEAVSNAA